MDDAFADGDAAEPALPDLTAAFVAAFPNYVATRLNELGLSAPPGFADAVADGATRLHHDLSELMAIPLDRQRRTPLELFQQALAGPTEALRAAGTPAPQRDPVATAALPGDEYDLAPASSRQLGDEAWRTHVAWGIAKAKAVANVVPAPSRPPEPIQPVVALVGVDLMDRTKIEPVVAARGYSFSVWRNPAAIEEGLEGTLPAVVLVDLTHQSALDAIRACTAVGVRTVAFGPHVDDIALARARALGAMDAVARSRFFTKLGEYLDAMA